MEVSHEETRLVPKRHSQAASYWFPQAGYHLIDLEIADPNTSGRAGKGYFVNFMVH